MEQQLNISTLEKEFLTASLNVQVIENNSSALYEEYERIYKEVIYASKKQQELFDLVASLE